jgi:MFS transporter, Spinster family, sphingosine-1-phosphate transporter
MIKHISGPKKILLILTLIHFINYVDRQVIFPLFVFLKPEFNLSDFELGLLGSAFIIVYSIASIPLGVLADKKSRRSIIGYGVLFWSLITTLTGFARNYWQLFISRGFVAIGESSYAPAATSILSDIFPESHRSRVMGIYNIGLYLGGAVGMVIAGLIGQKFGWRAAFFIVGFPGLILSLLVFKIKEPERIISYQKSFKSEIKKLFLIPAYNYILVGATFIAFSSGSILSWITVYTIRYQSFQLEEASLTIGSLAIISGILGVLTGGWVSDFLHTKIKGARSITIGISFLLSVPTLIFVLHANDKTLFLIGFFLTSYFMSWYFGPVIAFVQEVVPPNVKATAIAFYFFFIHVFGDAFAPAIIGLFSDLYGLKSSMFLPVTANLFCGIVFLLSWRKVKN